MKTSGYFTPVRIVFWVVMLPILLLVIYFWRNALLNPHQQGNVRAVCIMRQRNLQHAVRSYANMNSLKIGDPIDWTKIMGPGNFIEKTPSCPVHGPAAYSYPTTFPPVGTLVSPCKDPAHKPSGTEDW